MAAAIACACGAADAAAQSYTVPADNPFVATAGARREVWAYGLRNPWRFSFDRATGDLTIADVGQDAVEEIDLARAGTGAGANYGWSCFEGTLRFNDCPAPGHVPPAFEYSSAGTEARCSITGGYVVRDPALTARSTSWCRRSPRSARTLPAGCTPSHSPGPSSGCGPDRLFVVEKGGIVKVVEGGVPSTFLDISADVATGDLERGLLSIAFPPDFALAGCSTCTTSTARATSGSRSSRRGGSCSSGSTATSPTTTAASSSSGPTDCSTRRSGTAVEAAIRSATRRTSAPCSASDPHRPAGPLSLRRASPGDAEDMGIGTSLFLIAVGAILYFAIDADVSGIEISTVGIILMVIGVIGLLISLFFLSSARRDPGRTVVRERDVY